jgi:hypothetical protein
MIDYELVEKFITKNKKYESIIRELLKATLVLSKKHILDNFEIQLNKWVEDRIVNNKNNQVYVMIEKHKIGSMNFLYFEFEKFFSDNNIIIYNEDLLIQENAEFMIFDDFSLSGTHLASTFEDYMYENINLHNSHKLSVICYMMSPVSTDLMESFEKSRGYEWLTEVKLYYSRIIIPFDSEADTELLLEFFKKFNPDTEETSYPFFAEYKLPNQFASFPTIYGEFTTIDREFMKDVKPLFDSQKTSY